MEFFIKIFEKSDVIIYKLKLPLIIDVNNNAQILSKPVFGNPFFMNLSLFWFIMLDKRVEKYFSILMLLMNCNYYQKYRFSRG